MKRHHLLLLPILATLLFWACGHSEKDNTECPRDTIAADGTTLSFEADRRTALADLRPSDTTQHALHADLRLAVMPTAECLPFIMAKEWGIYDSLGLSAYLFINPSQIDCEQALLDGLVDASVSDLFRTARMQYRHEPVKMAFRLTPHWQLIARQALRASKINQISSCMMATTRSSTIEYLTDYVESKTSSAHGPLLRPQINNILLRNEMLLASQIDVALLPTFQAEQAKLAGHQSVWCSAPADEAFNGLAVSADIYRSSTGNQYLKLLRTGYDIAARRLRQLPTLRVPAGIMRQLYLTIPQDSIRTETCIHPSSDFKTDDVSRAARWLNTRDIVPTSFRLDTLLH